MTHSARDLAAYKPLLAMLALQEAMNTQVHADWRARGHAWYRAIWIESAELMDHYGWKWWKKQTPDLPQVQLELVDIWHFGLSDLLQQGQTPEQIAEALAPLVERGSVGGDFRELLEDFAAHTLAQKRFDAIRFCGLMAAADFSFTALYEQYVGKNVLNRFRQDRGYQTGEYRKIWAGREDNAHLAELLNQLNSSDPDFQHQLYTALDERYQTA
jgi:hypothetical protein